MGAYFSIARFWERMIQIMPYIKETFSMVVVSMLFGTILAIIVAMIRIKKVLIVDQLLTVYISFMRGTPLIVQMCIAYYGIPILLGKFFLNVYGIDLNRVDTIYFIELAFILNEAAFLGEIFRSAILSVPAVQTEAGYSVGMTFGQTFFRIILPQAFHVAIPHYGVDLIGVFQNTSLAFTLGVMDLMGRAKTLGTATGHSIEGFVAVAVIYIVISLILKGIFRLMEKNMRYGRG